MKLEMAKGRIARIKMTVKELIEDYKGDDIDVYDDYDESVGVAYCGQKLTEAGYKEFAPVLNNEVRIDVINGREFQEAVVHAEDDAEVEHLSDLFNGMAGFCSAADYDKWFIETED